jgi:hypothetical protein
MGASDAATYATLEFGNVGYTPVLADAGFAYFPRNTVVGAATTSSLARTSARS